MSDSKSKNNNILVGCLAIIALLCMCGGGAALLSSNTDDLAPTNTELPIAQSGITTPTDIKMVVNETTYHSTLAVILSQTPIVVTDTPTPPVPTAVKTASLNQLFPCLPVNTQSVPAKVTRIVDGDTIHVDIGGQDFTVRYIGIDTPEDTTTHEEFGEQATDQNRALVENKDVILIKDVSETDQYGRLLRYVLVGNKMVNYELVRLGYANASTYPPDVACADLFANGQQRAASMGYGLWALQKEVTPVTRAISTKEAPATNNNCDPSYPTVCIPPAPPDLDCKDIPYRRFQVVGSDPHNFDGNHDGVGCESN